MLNLSPKQQRVLSRHNNEFMNEYVYNVLIHSADSFEIAQQYFQEMQQHTPLQHYLQSSQFQYVIAYNVLINKAPYEKGIELFEEMQQNGLQPNVITFNTLLKKANHSHQAFNITLDLLEQMLALRIKPQAQEGFNQKGRKMKPHTVYAVQSKLRNTENREEFRAWMEDKRRKLQTKPKWLREAWEQFFQKLE